MVDGGELDSLVSLIGPFDTAIGLTEPTKL
jgi:hypothetical protein